MTSALEQLRAALADRYEVAREIGSGGMATVYLARDLKHDRNVALKVLRPELAAAIGTERFFREIRIAARLHHPHILPLYDSGQTNGVLYYVMPFVDGRSLRQRLKEERQLSIDETIKIARQVAAGLECAHHQGIVHRDIKPENILLNGGEAVVTDFGIALALHAAGGERLTYTGLSIGTPEYMSPEQATGDRNVDARTDIYSLGCVVYEMLCGEPPYRGPTAQAVVARLLTERVPDPRSCRDTTPEQTALAVRRALAKVPADRFATAPAFAQALVAPPLRAGTDPGRLTRRRSVTALILVLAAAAAGLWAWSSRSSAVRSPAPGRLSLLVSSVGFANQPALSPDGRLLAYVGSHERGTDLFVRLVSGGEPVRVTQDPALEAHPAFSPDGARIAYVRRDSAGGAASIWVVPSLGGQAAEVATEGDMPTWAPHGGEIAFVRRRPGDKDVLMRSRVDGTSRQTVFVDEAPYLHIRRPTWSPDGELIAVERTTGGASGELWLVPAQGGRPRRLLTEGPGVGSHEPAFTSDGSGIVHSSNRGGATNLWIARLDGGLTQLTTGSGPDASPAVSQLGTVAYANSRWRVMLEVHGLTGAAPRTVLTHTPYVWAPAFAPDGRELAFSRAEADGAWHIWITPLDGGAPRQLTRASAPTVYPRFTPDGRGITYFTWTSGSKRIWRVPRGGGVAEPLTPENEDAAYGDISPDGAWLAFVREDQTTPHLHVMPVAGGPARRVVEGAGTLPRWSPDGRWLAFTRDRTNEGGIFIVRPDGTEERRLTTRGGWPVWWPDGTRVAYLLSTPDGKQEVHTVPLHGGPSVHLAAVRFNISNAPIDISTDGQFLATTNAAHLSDEIWLLELPR
jgi:serine/threonine-protein kinase